ncbi:MAG: 4Fe-4S binding protein [Bacteroidales bacterium]|nr:4Fe-4S binding protein [Bacteroidales bacterium]
MELIKFDRSKCVSCYACVRACPVKAIQIDEKDNGIIIKSSRCIGCGACFVSCNPKAISYHNSIDESLELIANNKCMAIVDPSIAAEFPDIVDYRNFVGMIRALGFSKVCEIAHGAELVANEYKKLLENFKGKYYITSACTPVVEYVRKYQKGIIDSLIPVVTPMLATAIACKEIYGDDIKIIAITPCIGQKFEANEYSNLVDSVLTFEELRILFNKNDIKENSVEFSEFDPPYAGKGSLFPISEGILEVGDINTKFGENRIITRDGATEFRGNIDDFVDVTSVKHHLNSFFCKGCCTGPCISVTKPKSYIQNHGLVIDYTKKRVDFVEQLDEKGKKYPDLDLSRKFSSDDQRIPTPTSETVKEVIKTLGLNESEKPGCMACGYKNCNDFALHVAKGLVKPQLCVAYTLKSSKDSIKKLTSTNQKLEETQQALESSERKLRKDHEMVKETMDLFEGVMQKLPSGVVLVDQNLKVVQANERFINLIGEEAEQINEIIPGLVGADVKTLIPQTVHSLFNYVFENNEAVENKDITYDDKMFSVSVFPIKKGEVAGAIFKDLLQPEVRSEEAINRVNEVIEKNLHMVQQIGFLLGEGASETEKMLNSIIESYQKGNSKD